MVLGADDLEGRHFSWSYWHESESTKMSVKMTITLKKQVGSCCTDILLSGTKATGKTLLMIWGFVSAVGTEVELVEHNYLKLSVSIIKRKYYSSFNNLR